MKIRVLSDLHIDVNEDYPLNIRNKDIFTIIAGDTAGDPKSAIDWIQQNIRKGLVITGNHLVYNDYKKPVQDLKQYFANAFPKKGPITYLDKMTGVMSKEIDSKLFIGTTLYTDYKLYPNIPALESMKEAFHPRRGMNDFHYGLVREKDKIRQLTPRDYLRWFIESKKEIKRLVEANPEKEIVLITHHCPSPQCTAPLGMDHTLLYPSYASNLEDFILAHSNIKLWITGHAHKRNTFKVGNCTVLQNPRGYEERCEADDFSPDTFVDTKTWQVEKRPFKCAQWERQRHHDFARILNGACWSL